MILRLLPLHAVRDLKQSIHINSGFPIKTRFKLRWPDLVAVQSPAGRDGLQEDGQARDHL